MLRLRRYRIFVALTVVFLFLLYRSQLNSALDDSDAVYDVTSHEAADTRFGFARKGAQDDLDQKPVIHNQPSDSDSFDKQDQVNIPDLKPTPDTKDDYALPKSTLIDDSSSQQPAIEDSVLAPPPAIEIPERGPGKVEDVYANKNDDIAPPLHIQQAPGRVEPSVTFDPPIHWTKLPENFPIDEASMITLPTGTPKKIPTIQSSKFAAEDAESSEKRISRMNQIKVEMKRGWDAYKTFAFGHDELVPFDRGFRDPFCGWAATLVDAMDTLWIMGLKDEFDEAYDGLKAIDFTTTPRPEIPVFETTIRYLGGLIAAYDVTGGHKGDYPMLLKKAVELAEILMGVFDTPNRMPILYYNWKPAFVSQPKRANTRAGIAEFGTLSMEFTRLAQLTGQDKYYDAIARVTNALDEWQNREDETASLMPGIFPENIDASGCNRSATSQNAVKDGSSMVQEQYRTTGLGQPQRKPQGYVPMKSGSDGSQVELRGTYDAETTSGRRPSKRQTADRQHPHSSNHQLSSPYTPDSQPLTASGLPADWDCVPQNLTASPGGVQSYSMGGSQDSAYEYFPKQYLLLGGLEAKYRSMHEKTVAAVKKWLLFRPMVKSSPDILFSAKAKVSTNVNYVNPADRIHKEYEITHLTCFIGGMFALGGKIFDSDEDLDIGRRLTDGCVWAYASMPAGIMAEFAQVTPCPGLDSCEWNETAWHLSIDPNPESREQSMRNYEVNLVKWEERRQMLLRKEAERLQAEVEYGQKFDRVDEVKAKSRTQSSASSTESFAQSGSVGADFKESGSNEESASRRDDAVQYQKRDLDTEQEEEALPYDPSTLDKEAVKRRIKALEAILDNSAAHTIIEPPPGSFGGTAGQVPIDNTDALELAKALRLGSRPRKPFTHEEYVQNRILDDHLPPGYSAVGSGVYTLRPEAIESVWYMYRITGDSIWQEKGWRMWESVIGHVRTAIAATAINGVHIPGGTTMIDKMESFWLAETLKYFYLLYSDPNVVSLDDWVLNTEAHPFRRPS